MIVLSHQSHRHMQSIQFRWIQAFRAVALTGSTTGAAEMLNIGQSAVSKQVAALESQLGVCLFDRSGRGLRLTPEGEVLFGEADTALKGYERFRRIADDVRQLKRGHLHIIAASNLARGLLPNALEEFQRDTTSTTFSIQIAARQEVLARIQDQQFDLAVLALPFEYPAEGLIDIGSYRGVCILPSAHPLSKKKSLKIHELAPLGLISLPVGTVGRMQVDRLFGDNELDHTPLIEATGGLAELVSAGLGAAIVDPFTAAVARSDAVSVRKLNQKIYYRYGILFPINRPRSALSVRLAEVVEQVARRTGQKQAS